MVELIMSGIITGIVAGVISALIVTWVEKRRAQRLPKAWKATLEFLDKGPKRPDETVSHLREKLNLPEKTARRIIGELSDRQAIRYVSFPTGSASSETRYGLTDFGKEMLEKNVRFDV
jgi:predicted transcriptional regulator